MILVITAVIICLMLIVVRILTACDTEGQFQFMADDSDSDMEDDE